MYVPKQNVEKFYKIVHYGMINLIDRGNFCRFPNESRKFCMSELLCFEKQNARIAVLWKCDLKVNLLEELAFMPVLF